jgi:hypothetical protein
LRGLIKIIILIILINLNDRMKSGTCFLLRRYKLLLRNEDEILKQGFVKVYYLDKKYNFKVNWCNLRGFKN